MLALIVCGFASCKEGVESNDSSCEADYDCAKRTWEEVATLRIPERVSIAGYLNARWITPQHDSSGDQFVFLNEDATSSGKSRFVMIKMDSMIVPGTWDDNVVMISGYFTPIEAEGSPANKIGTIASVETISFVSRLNGSQSESVGSE